MDFGKAFIKQTNVITESGIRLLPVPDGTNPNEESTPVTQPNDETDKHNVKANIDRMLIQSANKAATELYLSTGSKLQSTFLKQKPTTTTNTTSPTPRLDLVNCSLYHSLLLPPTPVISPGSLVVIFESFDSLNFVYANPRSIFNNRNGHFHHDDFIGKPYGCKIRSRNNRGLGFVYLLKPTPELWARSLNHRTQIVHELDASMVVFEMGLKPNMIVCESGTGSGAMTHAMLRAVAPRGMVHTYEFNQMRVNAAREDFKSNGVGHLVKVHWRDVCGKLVTQVDRHPPPTTRDTDTNKEQPQPQPQQETMGSGGFDIGPAIAHAIFLDLPEPWLAIPHAASTLRPNGTIASYSPCVEQSQKTVQKMKKCGFHTVRTLEVRLREHYMDEVAMETVPTKRLVREPNVNPFIPGVSVVQSSKGTNNDVTKEESRMDVGHTSDTKTPTTTTTTTTTTDTSKKENKAEQGSTNKIEPEGNGTSKKRKLLCARPFTSIRGHTAFLTFATNGNKAFYAPSKQPTVSIGNDTTQK